MLIAKIVSVYIVISCNGWINQFVIIRNNKQKRSWRWANINSILTSFNKVCSYNLGRTLSKLKTLRWLWQHQNPLSLNNTLLIKMSGVLILKTCLETVHHYHRFSTATNNDDISSKVNFTVKLNTLKSHDKSNRNKIKSWQA